jgi:hypothetical protein
MTQGFYDVYPLIATVYVRTPLKSTQIYTRTFTSLPGSYDICSTEASGYITSFTYP